MHIARGFWSMLGMALAFAPVALGQGASPYSEVEIAPPARLEPVPPTPIDARATAQPAVVPLPESGSPQAGDEESRPVETPARSWYGWQTLTFDAAGVATVILGASANNGGVSLVGASLYALGGPAVHLGHGQYAPAAASLGMRLGLPIGGALGGALIGELTCTDHGKHDEEFPCPAAGAALGFVSGILTAIVVDAAVLAREPEAPSVTSPTALRLSPQLAFERHSAQIGLAGAF